jgi:hypothetical protein
VAEPHAFTKPVFQIGLGGWKASNVEASGAIEMSRGDVLLASFANFSNSGHVCWNVNVSESQNEQRLGLTVALVAHNSTMHSYKAECLIGLSECKVFDRAAGRPAMWRRQAQLR